MFLKYSDMWDMPLGGTSSEKQIPHWFGNFAWALLAFVFKICFRYEVTGREKLRAFDKESGVLLVANHTSFLDVAFMYLVARPAQWVRFMGRDTLFDNAGGLVGQILSRVGAFPVKRDSADRTSIKRAARMLKNDEVVGILPEGTRRGKGTKTPTIHSGAAFVARMGHAPILPMTVRDAENVKRKGQRLRFPKITIEYGDPLLVSDFDFLPKDERLDGCAWYAMRECFALSQRVSREQVDMVELFPESRDFTEVFAAHPIPHHTSEELVEQMRAERMRKEQKAKEAASADEVKAAGAAAKAVASEAKAAETVAKAAAGEAGQATGGAAKGDGPCA